MNLDDRRLLELCAARAGGKGLDWSMIARVALSGDIGMLLDGVVPTYESARIRSRTTPLLLEVLENMDEAASRVDRELEAAETVGADLFTVFSSGYPVNLRRVHDLPPFIFVRGSITGADLRTVAVVGTRDVSPDGLLRASRMARELSDEGVTVASGLAKGVDTAAHLAALEAGGRTLAVLGTGITRCYPAENAALAERIAESGALISQFWPTRSPGRDTFPRRNRVTSGISQGTVVIEASSTSGAKMQARLAHEHGKQVWLIRSLVMDQTWAQTMVKEGRAKVVADTNEVIQDLADAEPEQRSGTQETQMTLEFR